MADAAMMPQRSRGILRMVALSAACLLGACQTLVPRGPVPQPERRPAAPTPVRAEPRVEEGIPSDTERNRVALLVPLSGSNAGVGKSIANATMLALLDSRSERVRITNYDTAAGAAAAAKRAIADGAELILGPLLSDDVRAVAPIAHAAHVPVLSFSNDSSVAGNGTYLMGYTPAQSIARVVGYASGQGVKAFAALIPNGVYGERVSTAFLHAVEDAGGQVVSLQPYTRASGAIDAAAGKLAAKAPYGAVLVADGGAVAASAAPAIRRANGAATHLLGTELWNSEVGIANRAALNGAWYASVSDGLYRQYAGKYRARYGASPYRLSSLGYDAVLLTVRIARDWRAGSPFPEARLRDRDGFAGIDGAFRFDRDGIAERALEVQEIRDGATVIVSPAPRTFAG